jgi:hypothetical protein
MFAIFILVAWQQQISLAEIFTIFILVARRQQISLAGTFSFSFLVARQQQNLCLLLSHNNTAGDFFSRVSDYLFTATDRKMGEYQELFATSSSFQLLKSASVLMVFLPPRSLNFVRFPNSKLQGSLISKHKWFHKLFMFGDLLNNSSSFSGSGSVQDPF